MRIDIRRTVQIFLLSLAAVFLLLHFVHLKADFPNHSPWVDWAKYTDEGWYGDAAIRHYLRGTWHLPGDFNPAAALPVWPLLEASVFRFTGVGIVAARALVVVVFGCILLAGYAMLVKRDLALADSRSGRPWAATGVLLLAVSPFIYVFSRMAILEPLLILLTLFALLTASAMGRSGSQRRRIALSILLGTLVALMIGTKTTAIFLLPSIAWMLWASIGLRSRALLRCTAIAGATAAALWVAYFALLIHRHLLADFRYLFEANQYTGIKLSTLFPVLWETLRDGIWIGNLLYPAVLVLLALSLMHRRLWRDPVFSSLAVWAGGYFVFLAYHANAQPRYYLVVAVPLTLLLVRGAEHLAAGSSRPLSVSLAAFIMVVVTLDARETLHFVRHPEYSFLSAASHVEQVVESEPNHSHVVLSISGSDLSLMTGLPSICDDFGTMELENRIAMYQPGWFVAWNYVEDDKMEALAKFYRLTRIAAFPAMDDPDRNLLIVYRLDPKAGVRPRRHRAHIAPAHLQRSYAPLAGPSLAGPSSADPSSADPSLAGPPSAGPPSAGLAEAAPISVDLPG